MDMTIKQSKMVADVVKNLSNRLKNKEMREIKWTAAEVTINGMIME